MDLEGLLARLRQRMYPETIPVLASYWLKTVYAAGHKREWWKQLHELLEKALRTDILEAPARDALIEIRNWIEQGRFLAARDPGSQPLRAEPFRTNLKAERLEPYIVRLLNAWLSTEVAGLLVNESEPALLEDEGMPVLAVGRALERLLIRERLSPQSLDLLLQPGLLSPERAYPAHVEILRDVVLALLGRTSAPPPPIMPAAVLGVAAGAALPSDYREAVRHAALVQGSGGDEVQVPIAAEQAREILNSDRVRLASHIVTMDGRWWESESLLRAERTVVIYKPRGRLRIDYSADHARLEVPWPDTRLRWPGAVRFGEPLEIFGREWHVASWEMDGKRARLHLVFVRAVPIAMNQPSADPCLRRSRPASVDIAWAALENALHTAVSQKSREPVEQMRRSEFIPLGRALFGFAESIQYGRLPRREAIETHLNAIRYLQAELCPVYGRVPWRILPLTVRAAFGREHNPGVSELLNQVFEGSPGRAESSGSPPQAA